MAAVTVTMAVDCEVSTSAQAHQLGQEIETRLYNAITALMPNLRYSENILSGTIHFTMEIEGRRITISRAPTVNSEEEQ